MSDALDIAIIGLAGRFPGAPSVAALWRNLCDGVESIARLDEAQLSAAGVTQHVRDDPRYVRAAATLDDVALFDAELFGIAPQEAAALDPQHRLFLECAYEAFEAAGYDPAELSGRVGVYAGSSMNGYLFHLFPAGARVESAEDMSKLLALDKDFLATRVSYKLNLRGPSVAVQTACSTSLVAVHLACQSLLVGECELALAGGVSIAVPQGVGYLYQDGGIASPDGHCRPFDAAAQGTVAGSGVGLVLLKRLEDALRDGDEVVAVIKGSAINNDGHGKLGFTAPSVEGQARAIREAHLAAGVSARSITYVEAHGTGTPLGDPIEVAALTQAFRHSTEERGFCALSSVKSNLGHLDAAAGVTGLIKAALALKHRTIPGTLHFAQPNPALGLEASPFFVPTQARAWAAGPEPRRAGVSSFGIGGTNAHVVLEEPPTTKNAPPLRPRPELIVLSARSSSSLAALSSALCTRLSEEGAPLLPDVAHTLRAGRRSFPFRRALTCTSREEAIAALATPATSACAASASRLAFLFPGQGAQQAGAGRALYQSDASFRAELDRAAELVSPQLGLDVRALLFPEAAVALEAETSLARTSLTQPALFVLEYALARRFMALGATPDALLGHSLGEYVAACLSGTLALEDALRLVCVRGLLMETTPEGAMLAVAAAAEAITPLLTDRLALAAINAPRQCVLSGDVAAVDAAQRILEARDVRCRRLRVARAFHSPLMDGVLSEFREVLATLPLRAPAIPWISNLTGTWITAAEAQDPDYWVRQLRGTVRFSDALDTLAAREAHVLLEVGPGSALSGFARQHSPDASVQSGLPEGSDGRAALLGTLGQLWVQGASIDWRRGFDDPTRLRVSLPTTPFERKRYWIDAPAATEVRGAARMPSPEHATQLSTYVPSFERAPLGMPAQRGAGTAHWLIFAGHDPLIAAFVDARTTVGDRITRVVPGDRYAHESTGYRVRVDEPDDYRTLARALVEPPTHVIHALAHDDCARACDPSDLASARALGVASVLWTARELAGMPEPPRLLVLARGLHDVTGVEALHPEHAPLIGAVRSLAGEYPRMPCRLLDLCGAQTPDVLLREARDLGTGTAPVVVHRGAHRWLPTLAAWSLPGGEGAGLREGGCYLITGGLGGLGLALAAELGRRYGARLVLLSRAAPSGAQADALAALRLAGIELLAIEADVAVPAALAHALDASQRRFGTLHGVIHAAGVAEAGLVETLTKAALEAELAAKLTGTVVLLDAVRPLKLDFVVLCSSLTALSGGVAQAGYAAANAFLDAIATASARDEDRASPTRVVSLGLDRVRGVGMAARIDQRLRAHGLSDERDAGITPIELTDLLARLLAQPTLPAHVAISRTPLRGMPEDALGALLRARLLPAASLQGASMACSRSRSLEDTRAEMHAIWARALGVVELDVERDFYALGGESLLALQILNQVREVFRVELPLRAFFEYPTVAALAAHVHTLRTTSGGAPAADDEPALVALPRTRRATGRKEGA